MAQIAAEVVRGYVKHPRRVKFKNFLLEFSNRRKRAAGLDAQQSKSAWLAITGVKGDKRHSKKRPLPKPPRNRSS